MATSKIKTGLRLVQIPNSSFTWRDDNKSFTCSKTNAVTNTGLDSIVGYLANGKANFILVSCAIFPDLNSNYLQVLGWLPKSGSSISSYNIDDFKVFAIGY